MSSADNQQPSSSLSREGSETKVHKNDLMDKREAVYCQLCIMEGGFSASYHTLHNHLKCTHKLSCREYLVLFPEAATTSEKYRAGFRSRLSWNKGLTKETSEAVARNAEGVSRTRRRMSMQGRLRAWNKGLTKETSSILREQGELRSGERNPQFGKVPWNKGLTKETSEAVARNAEGVSRTRQQLSEMGKLGSWCKGLTKETDPRVARLHARRQKTLRRRIAEGRIRIISNGSRYKQGFREDLGHHVRSSWEANFARVLKFLGLGYRYESRRFSIMENGDVVDTFLPDFYIESIDRYYEVKGYVSPTFGIKWSRFKEQYPEIDIVLIGPPAYKCIMHSFSDVILNWEH